MWSRCGCGPGWGPRDLGAQGGLNHGPVGRKKGGWSRAPGEEGCGGRALWSRGPGKSRGAPHLLGTAAGPQSRRRASQGCLAGEAAGSAEPTPAHTLPESMLSAALGTSCRVAGSPGPPPGRRLAKLGAAGSASGGRGVCLSPFRAPSPCLAFARLQAQLLPTAPAAGNGGVHVISRSPRPGPGPGGQRPRGAAAARWTCSRCARRAPGPREVSRLWKGVCEPGDVGAHTRCHTQSHGFVAAARKREEVALALSSRVWKANRVLGAWGPGDACGFQRCQRQGLGPGTPGTDCQTQPRADATVCTRLWRPS